MRVLLLNQFFWPDSSATGQLLTDVARELADNGHDVVAICSGKGGYAAEVDLTNPPRVEIRRVKALRFGRGRFSRILSYLTFYISATLHALFMRRIDVALVLTTPPLLPVLGSALKFLRGTRYYVWEMDIYPDVAVALNYFSKGGILESVIGTLADFTRRYSNGVIALGDCMRARLIDRRIAAAKISVCHNWADSAAIMPIPKAASTDKLTVLYSGNLGLAHDIETIKGAIEALHASNDFHFIFVGGGARRGALAAFVAQHAIASVELRPYAQRQRLNDSLASCDIGLVTQHPDCCGVVVPSKVYGLLAAGKPYIFIGPREATPAQIVETYRCGWSFDPGDVDRLTSTLRYLRTHPEAIELAGKRAREALLSQFDRHIGVTRIINVIESH